MFLPFAVLGCKPGRDASHPNHVMLMVCATFLGVIILTASWAVTQSYFYQLCMLSSGIRPSMSFTVKQVAGFARCEAKSYVSLVSTRK